MAAKCQHVTGFSVDALALASHLKHQHICSSQKQTKKKSVKSADPESCRLLFNL